MKNVSRLASRVAVIGLLSVSAACAAGRYSSPAEQKETLVHDGLTRRYVVRAPGDLARMTGKIPLVLVLHGGGGNAENAERMTGFTEKARNEGFIVAYPEGTSRRSRGRFLTWNAGHCCGFAMENRVKDVEFINALVDELLAKYPVDPRRIYVTGMSNGGMMTHRLGIELASRFAAIAPVVATVFGDEKAPALPVSAIMLNGMRDEMVPYQGGPPGRMSDAWDGTPTRPAVEQAAFWARANGCSSTPVRRDDGPAILERYRCPSGRAVEIHLIKDNGHAWPGGEAGSRRGDKPGTGFDGTNAIWAFFAAHPK